MMMKPQRQSRPVFAAWTRSVRSSNKMAMAIGMSPSVDWRLVG